MRFPLTLAATLTLAACSAPLTPTQQAAATVGVQVAAASTPVAGTVLADGQLACAMVTATGPLIVAMIDATTKAPVSVVGKASQTVANICSVIGGTPVAPPAAGVVLPVKAVVVPT